MVSHMVRHMVRIEVQYTYLQVLGDWNLFEFLIVQQPSTDVVAVCCGVFFCQLNSLNTPETFPVPSFLFEHTQYTKYVENYVEQQTTKQISSTRE